MSDPEKNAEGLSNGEVLICDLVCDVLEEIAHEAMQRKYSKRGAGPIKIGILVGHGEATQIRWAYRIDVPEGPLGQIATACRKLAGKIKSSTALERRTCP